MEFPDFKFPDGTPTFPSRAQIHKYLESYADHYHLRDRIHLKHIVTSVKRIDGGDAHRPRWLLTIKNTTTGAERTGEFDAVFVCTGHYSTPYIPTIASIENFRGVVLHSHDYRHPEPYAGKSVTILGGGPSAFDLALDLGRHASNVIVSVGQADRLKLQEQYAAGKLPPNIIVVKWPEVIGENAIRFADRDSADDVDAIIYCTGYRHSYPFLDESCGITIKGGKRVRPLFKHMINTKYQTMMFINAMVNVFDFTLAYAQVPFAVKILDGSLQLPSEEAMNADTEDEYERRLAAGKTLYHAHRWDDATTFSSEHYYTDLIAYAGLDHMLVGESQVKILEARVVDNIYTYRDEVNI
ncbi:PREDICTED: senecionine N-oxygenase-like isoform X2 [Priapulus caudatus]|nr:PREDICTED: senecionine N-oxygenase-like isoform X2 [Priapulus caudatus]